MNHVFENIEVKVNAPQLLEEALKKKRKKCVIGTGAMSDPYIQLEEKLQNTRKCLEIIEKYGFGLAIQTKSSRILRDLDILKSINAKAKTVVQMTMTTYDLPSPDHDLLMDIFRKRCAENGIIYDVNECFQYLHVFPEKYVQMSFVDNLQ